MNFAIIFKNLIYWLNFVFHVPQNRQAVSEPVGSEEGIVLRRNDEGVRRRKRMSVPENA